MEIKHVEGKNVGKIFLYALSTCVWCKKTKRLLNNLDIDYYYIDVDLMDDDERKRVKEEIKRWNPQCSFPTIVLNDEKCIVGYEEEKIKELSEK